MTGSNIRNISFQVQIYLNNDAANFELIFHNCRPSYVYPYF